MNEAAYHGSQRSWLPVVESGSEEGNLVLTMTSPMRELWIKNDSQSDMSFSIDGMLSFILKPGELMDERYAEFKEVIVTSSGAWRWFVRSGRVS